MIEVAGFRKMNTGLHVLCAVGALLWATGCTSPARRTATAQAQEIGAVQRATWKYRGSIKALTIKGETLMVSVDDHEWDALDPDVQDAIRDSTLSAWAKTWRAHHPHRKATLRVSVMGYFADQLGSASTTL